MKKIIVRLQVWLLIAALLVSFGTYAVNAEEENVLIYYGNELEPFRSRTKEEIGLQYAAALYAGETYQDKNEESYYLSMPSLEAPYEAGVLTEDTHLVMTAMTNYYRWLVGVEPLKNVSQHSDKLQAGALVRNFHFAHGLTDEYKPEDMDQELWEFGARVYHNILAMGYTPRGAITGWLNEGFNLYSGTQNTIGHRVALLEMNNSSMQFGYSGSVAIGAQGDAEISNIQPFAAYPAPGLMPKNSLQVNYSAWSIELNKAQLTYETASDVTVCVTDLNTGSQYECTNENEWLYVYDLYNPTIAFRQPEAAGYYYDEGNRFKVEVLGLHDVSTGKAATIVYEVEFFDVTPYTPSYVTSANVGWDNLVVTPSHASTESLHKLAAILPSKVTVKTENGRTSEISVLEAWRFDEDKNCWVNSADPAQLPEGVTDPNGVLKNICITYSVEDYLGQFFVDNRTPTAGQSGVFGMCYYYIGDNYTEIYQVVGNETDGYQGSCRFDKEYKPTFSVTTRDYLFSLDSWKTSDSGTWYGIYYEPRIVHTDAYLAGSCNIQVSEASADPDDPEDPESNENECPGARFADMPAKDNWAHTGIDFVVEHGLFGGTSENTFEPETAMTRAMLVTVLWRYEGQPKGYQNTFSDVNAKDGNWYIDAVAWASANGVVNGVGNGKFDPDGKITREQMAAILFRYAQKKGIDTSKRGNLSVFPDASKISGYAKDSVNWTVTEGIINGSDGKLLPQSNATRAQVATILMRFILNVIER